MFTNVYMYTVRLKRAIRHDKVEIHSLYEFTQPST